MVHLALGGLGILMLPELPKPAVVVLLALLNLLLAVGLIRYAFWSYRLAVACYFLLGIVNTISVNLPGILAALALLYLVGNGTAKAIFERRAAEWGSAPRENTGT